MKDVEKSEHDTQAEAECKERSAVLKKRLHDIAQTEADVMRREAAVLARQDLLTRAEADLQQREDWLRQRALEFAQQQVDFNWCVADSRRVAQGTIREAIPLENTDSGSVRSTPAQSDCCPACKQKFSVWWDAQNDRCGFCRSRLGQWRDEEHTREQRLREEQGCCFNCGASKSIWWDTKQDRCSKCGALALPTPAA